MHKLDFVARAEHRLSELQAEDDELASREESFRRRRAALADEAVSIRSSMSVYAELMGATPPSAKPPRRSGTGTDAQAVRSLADEAERVLAGSAEPMNVTSIVDSLRRSGRLARAGSSRAQYAALYSVLARDRRFVRLAPGRFWLTRVVNSPGSSEDSAQSRVNEPTMTVAEAAMNVLARADGPLPAREVVTALRDSGRLREGQSSRSQYAIVYSVLARDDRFVRLSPGVFALAHGVPILETDEATSS